MDIGSKYVSIGNTLRKFISQVMSVDYIFGDKFRDSRANFDQNGDLINVTEM